MLMLVKPSSWEVDELDNLILATMGNFLIVLFMMTFFWFNYFANMCRIGHQILKSFYQILKLDNICVDVIKQQDKIFLKTETCFRMSPHCVDFLFTEFRRLQMLMLLYRQVHMKENM